MSAVHTNATVANVRRIVILSERTASDGAFARQARRKFVSELLAVAEGDATAGVRSLAFCQMLMLSGPILRDCVWLQASPVPPRRVEETAESTVNSSGSSTCSRDPGIDAWLAKYELSDYAAGMKDSGYSSMRFLQAASEEDLAEMVEEIQMKRVHSKVFMAAWSELLAVGAGTARADELRLSAVRGSTPQRNGSAGGV